MSAEQGTPGQEEAPQPAGQATPQAAQAVPPPDQASTVQTSSPWGMLVALATLLLVDLNIILGIFRRTLKKTASLRTDGEECFVGFLGLHDTDLRKADLRNTNLEHADFDYADLFDAQLQNANLRGATFRYANLDNANLAGADLAEVKLERADLRAADLDGVQNYNQIETIWKANIHGVQNPPRGFSRWAKSTKRGAVSIEDDDDWRMARLE